MGMVSRRNNGGSQEVQQGRAYQMAGQVVIVEHGLDSVASTKLIPGGTL